MRFSQRFLCYNGPESHIYLGQCTCKRQLFNGGARWYLSFNRVYDSYPSTLINAFYLTTQHFYFHKSISKARIKWISKLKHAFYWKHFPFFSHRQFVKCGYAGSNFPAHIFPSMVGRPILRAVNKIGDIEVEVCSIYSFYLSNQFYIFQFYQLDESPKTNLNYNFLSKFDQKPTIIPILFTEFTYRCKF